MAGTKTSGRKKGFTNPYSFPLNLDAKIGEAINEIKKDSPEHEDMGSATFIVHDFFEHHEAELRNILGADFDPLFKKWSKTKTIQRQEDHDKTIAQYKYLGCSEEEAEETFQLFPYENPLDVIRQRNASIGAESKNQFLQPETKLMQNNLVSPEQRKTQREAKKKKIEALNYDIMTLKAKIKLGENPEFYNENTLKELEAQLKALEEEK